METEGVEVCQYVQLGHVTLRWIGRRAMKQIVRNLESKFSLFLPCPVLKIGGGSEEEVEFLFVLPLVIILCFLFCFAGLVSKLFEFGPSLLCPASSSTYSSSSSSNYYKLNGST
ncbi:hypothetical protein ACP275_11G139200 [Erythranthe tilingii]